MVELLLGRYRLDSGPILGQGGWCVVRRATDGGGHAVAVKTFTAQAAREHGDEALRARFQREVKTFQTIGVGPSSGITPKAHNPRHLFVNLLDYSKSADGLPGPATDGQYYTVLELADDSLDSWLKRCADKRNFVDLHGLCEIAGSIAEALAWLHSMRLAHLDLKPENIMRFGSRWKLIDLEGCLSIDGPGALQPENFTPLYASPEIASALLEVDGTGDAAKRLKPTSSMDTWAAGVVLLDVLAHGCCFAETKASFDAAALFDDESIPFEGWYRWLASADVLEPSELLRGTPGAELLAQHPELMQLLCQLLEKDPGKRLLADGLKAHSLLSNCTMRNQAAASANRESVEKVFSAWEKGFSNEKVSISHEAFLNLMLRIGVEPSDAARVSETLCQQVGPEFTFKAFLDFLYTD
eukprot:TRINITY_DN42082_c0_g1_i1.p1 TRINITY_DN42082_c0_g1~~TRINITY_DN42082_c0_g1_i1.p1  ORF type:complete len:435 (+),score=87.90 TRINITY_DN42082_c0_g1_i1:71-1306(+)